MCKVVLGKECWQLGQSVYDDYIYSGAIMQLAESVCCLIIEVFQHMYSD